jgi:hypothetical protein
MEKQLKDYLHLYIGCKIIWGDKNSPHVGTLVGLEGACTTENYRAEIATRIEDKRHHYQCFSPKVNQCLLVLRPLSDFKEAEADYVSPFALEGKPSIMVNADLTRHFCSLGIDCFGLIEAGLAIDATKATPEASQVDKP